MEVLPTLIVTMVALPDPVTVFIVDVNVTWDGPGPRVTQRSLTVTGIQIPVKMEEHVTQTAIMIIHVVAHRDGPGTRVKQRLGDVHAYLGHLVE